MIYEINLDIVDFEQAVKLEEIGFPKIENSQYYYKDSNDSIKYCHRNLLRSLERVGVEIKSKHCAPSLEIASKWLREEKDFCIHPHRSEKFSGGRCSYKYELQIALPHSFYETDPEGYSSLLGIATRYDSYEDALKEGINIALNTLKSHVVREK